MSRPDLEAIHRRSKFALGVLADGPLPTGVALLRQMAEHDIPDLLRCIATMDVALKAARSKIGVLLGEIEE